jgi:hypothetical protein
VVLTNGSLINTTYVSFYTLSGPPGEAADNINFNLADTISLTFGAAPGFENLTLRLIPEPATLAIVGLAMMAAVRARKHEG